MKRNRWESIDARSLLLPIPAALTGLPAGWFILPLEVGRASASVSDGRCSRSYSYERLSRCYEATARQYDGTAVRGKEYWEGWLTTEAVRRQARGWVLLSSSDDGPNDVPNNGSINDEPGGSVLGFGLFTAASWERREGDLPASTPSPVAICIKNNEFVLLNDEICIKNDDFDANAQELQLVSRLKDYDFLLKHDGF